MIPRPASRFVLVLALILLAHAATAFARTRFLRGRVSEEARAPTWSPDGHLIAFVDADTCKPVRRWGAGRGFDHANPTWNRTGVYIPAS